MRGLLMKDLELIKINMKMYLAVFSDRHYLSGCTGERKYIFCSLCDLCEY